MGCDLTDAAKLILDNAEALNLNPKYRDDIKSIVDDTVLGSKEINSTTEEEFGKWIDEVVESMNPQKTNLISELNSEKPKFNGTPIKVEDITMSKGTPTVHFSYKGSNSTNKYSSSNIMLIGLNQKDPVQLVEEYASIYNLVLGSKAEGTLAEEFIINDDTLVADALDSVEGIKAIVEKLSVGEDLPNGYKNYVLGLLDNVDIDFLPKMKLYINEEANENYGMIQFKHIALNVSKDKPLTIGEMTATEVYSHEIIHAITKFAISSSGKGTEADNIIGQIEDLRQYASKHVTPEDLMPVEYLDKDAELKEAKKRWDYIFSSKTGIQEFIAHGLTNPRLMRKLSAIKEEKEANLTIFEKLSSYVGKLIDFVFRTANFSPEEGTVRNELKQLTFELMKYNNRAAKNIKRKESSATKAYRLFDKLGNEKVKELFEKISSKLEGDIPKPPKNGTKIENLIYAAKFIPHMLVRPELSNIKELVLSSLFMKPEGTIQNMLRDMQEPTDLERAIEKFGLASDNIDGARSLLTSTAREVMLADFKKHPTEVQDEAITNSMLDLDLQSIYKDYNTKDLVKIYSNKEFREKEIKKVKSRLKKLDRDNFYFNINQATGLGYYMATGHSSAVQLFNATNITRGLLTEDYRSANKNIIKEIDTLATLVGIDYTATESNNIAANLIETETKGIDSIMTLSKDFKQDSRDKLFGNDVLMIKGYTKELYESEIDVRIRPLREEEEQNLHGYDLVTSLDSSKYDTNPTPMGIYKARSVTDTSYKRAATRMNSIAKKGMSFTDINNVAGEVLARERAARDTAVLSKKSKRAIKEMESGEYDVTDHLGEPAPILNEYGDIVDYRYMMSKRLRKELLEQDTKATEVLSRSIAGVYDKVNSDTHNKALLKLIMSDMKENYDPDMLLGKVNGKEYVRIEKDSELGDVREVYKLLPQNMITAIQKSDKQYIAVRRDMLYNYFGYRSSSIFDFMGLGEITPQIIQRLIKIAEALWKDIIAISKVDIIIRTPIVIIENVISNFLIHVILGRSPIKAWNKTKVNLTSTRRYLATKKEIARLQIIKGQTKRIADLEASLKLNPVHDLMAAGMYQAIVEDVNKRDLDSSNRLARRARKLTKGVPEIVKSGVDYLYLNENTGFFKFVTEATQLSDFVARATEYQFLLEEGKSKEEAQNRALDAFVNYGKPAGQFEDYLNDMGAIMFTKYAKRIQRMIFKTSKDKPVNIMLSVLLQAMLIDVSDIWDQQLLVRSYAGYDQNFIEHLERALVPTTLQFAGIVD